MGSAGPEAPGDLELVRQFVNTLDVEDDADAIASPETLGAWLGRHRLLGENSSEDTAGPSTDATSVRMAQALRESLRACLLANHEQAAAPPAARAVLNDIARRGRLQLHLDDDGQWRPHPHGTGTERALASIVAIVASAMTAGQWQRLKVCSNDECRWAFYDHSRARTGRWCSMQVCGNRSKQQSWRRRQAAAGAHQRLVE